MKANDRARCVCVCVCVCVFNRLAGLSGNVCVLSPSSFHPSIILFCPFPPSPPHFLFSLFFHVSYFRSSSFFIFLLVSPSVFILLVFSLSCCSSLYLLLSISIGKLCSRAQLILDFWGRFPDRYQQARKFRYVVIFKTLWQRSEMEAGYLTFEQLYSEHQCTEQGTLHLLVIK